MKLDEVGVVGAAAVEVVDVPVTGDNEPELEVETLAGEFGEGELFTILVVFSLLLLALVGVS